MSIRVLLTSIVVFLMCAALFRYDLPAPRSYYPEWMKAVILLLFFSSVVGAVFSVFATILGL